MITRVLLVKEVVSRVIGIKTEVKGTYLNFLFMETFCRMFKIL